MNVLPERVKEYYKSLSDEDILNKIKHLTNMEKQLGCSESLSNQLQEYKNEAERRGLDYKQIVEASHRNE